MLKQIKIIIKTPYLIMVKAREGMQSKEILEEDTSTVMKKKA